MKKLLLVVLMLSLSTAVFAQGSGIGVGFSSDGLEGKYWMVTQDVGIGDFNTFWTDSGC